MLFHLLLYFLESHQHIVSFSFVYLFHVIEQTHLILKNLLRLFVDFVKVHLIIHQYTHETHLHLFIF